VHANCHKIGPSSTREWERERIEHPSAYPLRIFVGCPDSE